MILDSPGFTGASLKLAAAPQQDSRRRALGPIAGEGRRKVSLSSSRAEEMVSKASAEAVDGGPSEKAGGPLLALLARGGATPQMPARGSWRLLPSRAKREEHLAATTTCPSQQELCSCAQRFCTMEVLPASGNAEPAKEPLV